MSLKKFAPKVDLIRSFEYPEGAEAKTQFAVQLKYVGQSRIREIEERLQLRIMRERAAGEDVVAPGKQPDLIKEILLEAVVKIENLTYRKLADLIPLDAEYVKANGGLNAEVFCDTTVSGARAEDARDSIEHLLKECRAFREWVSLTSGSITRFQDAQWKARLENLSDGQGTNMAESKADPETAKGA